MKFKEGASLVCALKVIEYRNFVKKDLDFWVNLYDSTFVDLLKFEKRRRASVFKTKIIKLFQKYKQYEQLWKCLQNGTLGDDDALMFTKVLKQMLYDSLAKDESFGLLLKCLHNNEYSTWPKVLPKDKTIENVNKIDLVISDESTLGKRKSEELSDQKKSQKSENIFLSHDELVSFFGKHDLEIILEEKSFVFSFEFETSSLMTGPFILSFETQYLKLKNTKGLTPFEVQLLEKMISLHFKENNLSKPNEKSFDIFISFLSL